MNKEFYNVVILIPSYQPDEKLTKYVNELIDNKFRNKKMQLMYKKL